MLKGVAFVFAGLLVATSIVTTLSLMNVSPFIIYPVMFVATYPFTWIAVKFFTRG